jgi:uncharacterized membrane protein YoaK (UPF0700 family)
MPTPWCRVLKLGARRRVWNRDLFQYRPFLRGSSLITGGEDSPGETTIGSETGASAHREAEGSASEAMIPRWLRLGTGVVLTAVAGFVDAVGFIELGGFFASFMSGASISLGVGASGSEWTVVYHAARLVAVFVTAATVSTVISGIMRPWGIPTAIVLEAVCLSGAVLMIESGWPSSDSVVPMVAAMGVQNTILHPVNGLRLGVTFMTGTLVSLSQALGRSFIGRARYWSWTPDALIWCCFVAGAAAGAWFYTKYGFIAVAGPTLVVWMLAALTTLAAVVGVLQQRRSALEKTRN